MIITLLKAVIRCAMNAKASIKGVGANVAKLVIMVKMGIGLTGTILESSVKERPDVNTISLLS